MVQVFINVFPMSWIKELEKINSEISQFLFDWPIKWGFFPPLFDVANAILIAGLFCVRESKYFPHRL